MRKTSLRIAPALSASLRALPRSERVRRWAPDQQVYHDQQARLLRADAEPHHRRRLPRGGSRFRHHRPRRLGDHQHGRQHWERVTDQGVPGKVSPCATGQSPASRPVWISAAPDAVVEKVRADCEETGITISSVLVSGNRARGDPFGGIIAEVFSIVSGNTRPLQHCCHQCGYQQYHQRQPRL